MVWTLVTASEKAKAINKKGAHAPGYFSSEMTGQYVRGEKKQSIIDQIPLNRFGHPKELDKLIVMLASRSVGFMTGSVLVVDGGQSIFLPG